MSDTVNNKNADNEQIGELNLKLEVLESGRPVLAAFLAPWIRLCQVIRPVLDEVLDTHAGRMEFVKVKHEKN
jgi:thioredoxin-like negative regulator of GroEL